MKRITVDVPISRPAWPARQTRHEDKQPIIPKIKPTTTNNRDVPRSLNTLGSSIARAMNAHRRFYPTGTTTKFRNPRVITVHFAAEPTVEIAIAIQPFS